MRIIAFFPKDVVEIGSIIRKEFKVHEVVSTKDAREVDRFGYRDDKYIVSIKEDWLKSPIYRNLELHSLKAEIQVRTILAHAWAELSHKLVYKKKEDVPEELVRDLNRASAALEELDEKFELLSQRKEAHLKEIAQMATTPDYWRHLPLNPDTLQSLLNQYFPNRRREDLSLGFFLQELLHVGLTMADLVESIQTSNAKVEEFEKSFPKFRFSQIETLRRTLQDSNDKWFEHEIERAQDAPYE